MNTLPTHARWNDSGDLDASTLTRHTVDRLAIIKKDIAELQAEELALKTLLIATGSDVIEGHQHRAAISYDVTRVSIDWQSIAQRFKPSRQLITAHTTEGAPFAVVRLSAKKTS
jgi:hypothetical protein